MKALLVRVGADQSKAGGYWNGPVNSKSGEFVYVPIPDDGPFHLGLATPYSRWHPYLSSPWRGLAPHLAYGNMHLDPDFDHLTYGDQGMRAQQIQSKLSNGDLLVFYAGMRDIHPNPRLVYAIIGLFVIDRICPAAGVPRTLWHMNAHTRRCSPYSNNDIVVFAKKKESGRLDTCLPIGSYRPPVHDPKKRPCYRVDPTILASWGGLSVTDGFLQRSAILPEFINPSQFQKWFQLQGVRLVQKNN